MNTDNDIKFNVMAMAPYNYLDEKSSMKQSTSYKSEIKIST